jgi:ribosomal protein S18 acetylase RimI-like enzyme
MDIKTLLGQADLNLAESLREQARFSADARLLELDGAVLCFGATRFPAAPFNALCCVGGAPAAGRLLDAAERAAAPLGRRFSVYAREHADAGLADECRARGYLPSGELSLLVLDRSVPRAVRAGEVALERVTDEAGVLRFAAVAAESFACVGVPARAVQSAFSAPTRVRQQRLRLTIGQLETGACATAALLLHAGMAGIYWVGTQPAARRRGLALACTEALANEALRGGQPVVVQVAPELEALYQTLGFRRVSRLQTFTNLRLVHGFRAAVA